MPNVISVSGEPKKWHGEGQIESRLQDFSDFNRWLNQVTIEFRNVIDRYQASVEDDGKIDIIEKKEIVREIDEYLNALIALRFHLYSREEGFSSGDEKKGYSYSFRKTSEGWEGEGVFYKSYNLNMEKFQTWYDSVMMANFNLFTEKYRKIVADGVIDEDEKKVLHPIIDQFIFEVLYIRYYIDKQAWKEK